jgi:hypothetical protein
MTGFIIPLPAELRPCLPTIVGNVDYLTVRQRLEQIDSVLRVSGLERELVEGALEGWLKPAGRAPSVREQQKFQWRSRRALRCNILRTLLPADYRGFSCQLAGNPLYQWFCLIAALDQIRVVKVVRSHARRHRQLLGARWQETQWTRRQAHQVLGRIDQVLELLPRAQKQAQERIIGGRLVENREKRLSLYEPDVHVIVRGKAGAEVEFGHTMLMGENRQGILLDFQIYKQQAPTDAHLLAESLERVRAGLGRTPGGVAADRGFSNAINHRGLEQAGIFNGICPRQPQRLKERIKDKKFVRLQRRRSQTEARIGLLKNGFWGRPMRAKGFAHRELALAWGVLTHNLWMFARLRKIKKNQEPLLKAA